MIDDSSRYIRANDSFPCLHSTILFDSSSVGVVKTRGKLMGPFEVPSFVTSNLFSRSFFFLFQVPSSPAKTPCCASDKEAFTALTLNSYVVPGSNPSISCEYLSTPKRCSAACLLKKISLFCPCSRRGALDISQY